MAYNIEAIRKKIASLEGNHSQINYAKFAPGEYKIRAMPWKGADPSMPFVERSFYYIGKERGFLAPFQFGKPDPVKELCNKLYASGNENDRALAKNLKASMRAYAPIIVRGSEADGVKIWSFSKTIYAKLLDYFAQDDVGDILSPTDGFDLKLKIVKTPGKTYPTIDVEAARKSSPLGSPEEMKKWLDAMPDVKDLGEEKSIDEIKTILDNWLADPVSSNSGTARGSEPEAHAASSADDSSTESKNVVKSKSQSKPSVAMSSLDAGFAELMED